jgi:predicted permease
MQSLLRNLRFAFRMMVKSPGTTVAILLTLTLGIGANSAIFSVTDALLLRPFPFRDAAQLVHIATRGQTAGSDMNLVRFESIRDNSRSFEQVSAWAEDNLNLTGDGTPVQAPIVRVTPNFFTLLGVQPALGRTFTAEEGQPQGKFVALLSDSLWRSRYGADPKIVGRAIRLDAETYTVIGVLPADPNLPFVGPADLWISRYFEFSLMPAARLRQGVGYLSAIARMRPAVTVKDAHAELDLLNTQYRAANPTMPDADPGVTVTAEPLRELVVGNLRRKVLILMATVALVLFIACGNVASLLLARGLARRREVAVRAALGASRRTILAQLLTESITLSLIAGVSGIALGWALVRALTTWGSAQLPHGIAFGMDATVLAFTMAVAVSAGILFGLFPALQLARLDLNSTLREEGRASSPGRGHARLMCALVVGQVALSVLLMVGAGLLMHSFFRLLHADPGFEANNVLTMNIALSTERYGKPGQQTAFFDNLLERVNRLPGVRNAAISAALPLSYIRITPVLPQGQPDVPLPQRPFVDIEAISPGWFAAMRAPLRLGRAFTAADQAQSPPVVVVNESFAQKYWPNQDPLTQHVTIGRRPVPAQVVGVAADVKNRGLEQDPQPQIYLPFAQLPWGQMYLLVRTAVPPNDMVAAIESQVAQIDPDQPVVHARTVDELIAESRVQPRFLFLLMGAFAGIALILTAIGIYGVLSYSVNQRTQELGVRIAMGAEPSGLMRMIVREGLVLAAWGTVLGLAAALLLARAMGSVLYKVGSADPLTLVCVPMLFLAIAAAATWLPARRAMRVSPMEILR